MTTIERIIFYVIRAGTSTYDWFLSLEVAKLAGVPHLPMYAVKLAVREAAVAWTSTTLMTIGFRQEKTGSKYFNGKTVNGSKPLALYSLDLFTLPQ